MAAIGSSPITLLAAPRFARGYRGGTARRGKVGDAAEQGGWRPMAALKHGGMRGVECVHNVWRFCSRLSLKSHNGGLNFFYQILHHLIRHHSALLQARVSRNLLNFLRFLVVNSLGRGPPECRVVQLGGGIG
jgi:hypothetical protein